MPLTPSKFRHELRGYMNALKLCVSVCDLPMETDERVMFLTDVVSSADKIVALLDQWDAQEPEFDTGDPIDTV